MIDDENRVNFILIKDNYVYMAFGMSHSLSPICPVTCFIGDRLADWNEYLAANPDIANNVEEIPEYDHYFRNHFNTYDFHWAFISLINFLKESKYLNDKSTLLLLEKTRSENEIPLNCTYSKDGIYYYLNGTMREILFSIIHYYVMNGYKLTNCKHCGLWFATKSLKTEYCVRRSPCYNMIVNNKPILREEQECEKAVRTITQKFRDRKKSIYNNWIINHPEKVNPFLNSFQEYMDKIKEAPNVYNITSMQFFLYSENMPKQERPNRRSNSEKRRLMNK